jgi:anti-sigma regulatory factor (Ser/Thr protein kinase)
MTVTELVQPSGGADTFSHEALFHEGDAGFLEPAVAFIGDGLRRDEAVLVVVTAPKVALLRQALGADVRRIHLADMFEVGRNPTRIISAWADLLAEHVGSGGTGGSAGRRARGIGEPVWPGRSPDELVECGHHEWLLNVAFGGGPPFWLLCPYDVRVLDPAIVDEAGRNHPTVVRGAARGSSPSFRGLEGAPATLDAPLPPPAGRPLEAKFGPGSLSVLRDLVADEAAAAGFGRRGVQDAVLAVSELATNTLLHGGGRGVLRLWRDGSTLVQEVADGGRIDDPLVGRRRPTPGEIGGRGLWLVNEVCDLVQLRSSAAGTVVRVHLQAG